MATEMAILDGDRIVARGLSWADGPFGDWLERHQLGGAAAGEDTGEYYVAALCPHERDEDLCTACSDDEPGAPCSCNPSYGQSCTWCDGTAADLGITPPAPDLPTADAWAAATGWPDPWFVPTDHPAPAPF